MSDWINWSVTLVHLVADFLTTEPVLYITVLAIFISICSIFRKLIR